MHVRTRGRQRLENCVWQVRRTQVRVCRKSAGLAVGLVHTLEDTSLTLVVPGPYHRAQEAERVVLCDGFFIAWI